MEKKALQFNHNGRIMDASEFYFAVRKKLADFIRIHYPAMASEAEEIVDLVFFELVWTKCGESR